MSDVLNNGYIQPQDGDLGSDFWDELAANIQRVNDHNHNGINSEKLSSFSIAITTDSIIAADFTIQAGIYRATKVLPAGLNVDEILVTFRDPSTKNKIYLDFEKIDTTSFYAYALIPQDLEVIYG